MRIAMIAAMGENRELGMNNDLLWHISDDLKRFKRITSGHTVIMGRQTFESIGSRPLPKRRNIVLSRNTTTDQNDVEYAASVDEVLKKVAEEDLVFVIGGAKIYELFLPQANVLHLTHVHSTYMADCYFPDFPKDEWELVERVDVNDDEQAGVNYSYLTLHRKL
jgi:dihydrofolate reductase